MPTYQYRCTECGSELEVVQKFTDDPLSVCPECDGALRKVFNAVGVVFKGSGFYATDNRTKGKTAAAKAEPSKSDASTSTASSAAAPTSGGSSSTGKESAA
ncbi:MAG: FmdB family transcriptional regulator [Actinobacteria bacterium HGW-Actinobacteria-2]|nr:MAG: FmdB family transcriptional regulator [Actinobacteria bacterium HGW-Actinobacteria-2]